jgi:ATP-dependent RNA helicase RhlE
MPFEQLVASPALMRNVRQLGYRTPTPIQERAIPVVASGRDLIATAKTGTGKTAAFLLPILDHAVTRPGGRTAVLVLTPTRELAQQIEGVVRGLAAGTRVRSALVVGGAPFPPQQRALRAGVELVIATPGRLLDQIGRGAARFDALRTLILDEADQMFDMGFLPDLKRIIARLPARRQTLLFSATMPPAVAELSAAILRNPGEIAIGLQGTPAEGVSQTAYPVSARQKPELLRHLLTRWKRPSVLVFTRTKHGARKLARALDQTGHRATELHGNRTPAQRLRAMQDFRSRKVPVLVATNIAARGIDIRHVTHVVNFDVPTVPEDYVHRIGRTGRAGDTGVSLTLLSPEEAGLLRRIERKLGKQIPREQVPGFAYEAVAPAGRVRNPRRQGPRGRAIKSY